MTHEELKDYIAVRVLIGNTNDFKIVHPLFDKDEYLYIDDSGNVYDENGYLFEDWVSDRSNGLRMRTEGDFATGWEIINDCQRLNVCENE